MTTTRIHRDKAAFDENVSLLLRQGYGTQSNDGKRAVLFKEPGYGHPLLHIAVLFIFPIIGNIIVAWLARCGMGHSVTIEYKPPIRGQAPEPPRSDTTRGKENPT